jgi:hypothetical protein
MTYTLYLYYKDVYLCKWHTNGQDMDKVYDEFAKDFVERAFREGYNIKRQIKLYHDFLNHLYNQRRNCEKVKTSNLLMGTGAYFGLIKFNQFSHLDYHFLKNKNRKCS